jgi:hypothetical protein
LKLLRLEGRRYWEGFWHWGTRDCSL